MPMPVPKNAKQLIGTGVESPARNYDGLIPPAKPGAVAKLLQPVKPVPTEKSGMAERKELIVDEPLIKEIAESIYHTLTPTDYDNAIRILSQMVRHVLRVDTRMLGMLLDVRDEVERKKAAAKQ